MKLREMEAEIRHMFLYGALNHLGMDGYKEFLDIRLQVKIERIQAAQAQRRAREQFRADVKYALGTGLLALALFGVLVTLYWIAN